MPHSIELTASMSFVNRLELIALPNFPLVKAGDDLAELISSSSIACDLMLKDGDVVVVAQKVVSKAEDRMVDLASIIPSAEAVTIAAKTGKDPRLVELILLESRRVVRCTRNALIVEHKLGYVMANAGVDQSNVGPDDGAARALLLPKDPDQSAKTLQGKLESRFQAHLAVVVNDSFGRPWRRGTVGVALGVAGLPAWVDKRGEPDLFGRKLRVTTVGYADEIAAAASLLMGQAAEGCPVVVARGLRWAGAATPGADLIRPDSENLFR